MHLAWFVVVDALQQNLSDVEGRHSLLAPQICFESRQRAEFKVQ